MVKQSAFVFIKPHANKPKVQELVKTKFDQVGITVVKEGDIKGTTIDSEKLIDQHYYAIASKATILPATELPVPADKFKDTFGEEWQTVIDEKRVYNALDIQKALGWDTAKLNEEWDKTSDKASPKTRVKFGGGFYCGKFDVDGKTYYTFNAFFTTMRGKFCGDNDIHYYVVEFDSGTLAWADFRGKVLGPTDPAAAPADSLRGMANADWESLGLTSQPNTGDNAVHASASPFEGMAERTNWLKTDYSIETDEFAKILVSKGISADTIKAWSVDPQVKYPAGSEKEKGSLFDAVEDMDLDECVAKLVAINTA
jgi:nucleoside diphosphate kinase